MTFICKFQLDANTENCQVNSEKMQIVMQKFEQVVLDCLGLQSLPHQPSAPGTHLSHSSVIHGLGSVAQVAPSMFHGTGWRQAGKLLSGPDPNSSGRLCLLRRQTGKQLAILAGYTWKEILHNHTGGENGN